MSQSACTCTCRWHPLLYYLSIVLHVLHTCIPACEVHVCNIRWYDNILVMLPTSFCFFLFSSHLSPYGMYVHVHVLPSQPPTCTCTWVENHWVCSHTDIYLIYTCTPFSLESVNSTRECICVHWIVDSIIHACITGCLVKVSTSWIMMALGWYVCAASIITDYPPTLQCSIPLILSRPSAIHVRHASTCMHV